MHQVFLGIGGNIGNKHDNFDKVYTFIKNELGTITKRSSVYETPPWGFQSEDVFWNQVLMIETDYSPFELLQKITEIETLFGRERNNGYYKSRAMDIDILYFDDDIINTSNLTIPHPLLYKRLFVLVPLAEIAPLFLHPVLKQSSLELLKKCEDKPDIKKVENYRH
jgi:2-amino-4-hydroxy-6-hydroxymethyldihydropteridine diphosphokinase